MSWRERNASHRLQAQFTRPSRAALPRWSGSRVRIRDVAPPIKVLVLDEEPLVHVAARQIFRPPRFVLVGVGDSLDDVSLEGVQAPNVVVSDVSFHGHRVGASWWQAVHHTSVVFWTSDARPYSVALAALNGAQGYVLKSDRIEDLCRLVEIAAAGDSAMGERTAMTQALPPAPNLRERAIISRIVAGDANAEIARTCSLTLKTVETYIRRMFLRYSVLSRTELAILALRVGWIDDPGCDVPYSRHRGRHLPVQSRTRPKSGDRVLQPVWSGRTDGIDNTAVDVLRR